MITTLLFAALTVAQDTPAYRDIERLKFEALHKLDQGRFVWEAQIKQSDQPETNGSFSLTFNRNGHMVEVEHDGERDVIMSHTEAEFLVVSFNNGSYTQIRSPESLDKWSEQQYEAPQFETGIAFVFGQDGSRVELSKSTTATLVDSGSEVVDGVEYAWYEHQVSSETSRGRVKQWFRKGTWLVYKMTVHIESDEKGELDATVKAAVMDTETPVTDDDLKIDPSVYAGMRKMSDPSKDPRWKREPREGLPDVPSYDEIEKLKIEAMRSLKSGRFHYRTQISGFPGDSSLENKFVFNGDEEQQTSWLDDKMVVLAAKGANTWLTVYPQMLSYTSERPDDPHLRSSPIESGEHDTELLGVSHEGLHFFTGNVKEAILLDYGEQKVDGVECVWYEHKIRASNGNAIIKQWFKKGTWLTYMTDVDANNMLQGDMLVTVRAIMFEPEAQITEAELLLDPATYKGFRQTSADNPTGLGRDALDLELPSYQEINRLKFQELLDLDSGKFTFVTESKQKDEVIAEEEVQYVFRGDEYRVCLLENGEPVNESALLNGRSMYVFHKLESYMNLSQGAVWSRADEEFTRLDVEPNYMRLRNYWTGVYIFLNEVHKPKLVATGEEIVDGTACVWYEHEVLLGSDGFIIRQWFKKDTWLMVKLEARAIEGLMLLGTFSARVKVFEPNAGVTDEDLTIDPERYEGYRRVDPPIYSERMMYPDRER